MLSRATLHDSGMRRFNRGSMEAKNVEHKLIVLGNQGVGKTALVTRLVHDVFEDNYTSTIGMDFFTKTVLLGIKAAKF